MMGRVMRALLRWNDGLLHLVGSSPSYPPKALL